MSVAKLALLFPLLTGSLCLSAGELNLSLTGNDDERVRWDAAELDMSTQEYKKASRRNVRLVRDFVRSYSADALSAVGVPDRGVAVLGTAASFAVTREAGVYLNQEKSFALKLRDATDSDRMLFLGFEKSW